MIDIAVYSCKIQQSGAFLFVQKTLLKNRRNTELVWAGKEKSISSDKH
jgi:hypothetical protein